jgi:hypothetical protein
MENQTKYVLAGIVFVLWLVVRFWLMRRRSDRIRELRERAPESQESREAEKSEIKEDEKTK